MYCVQYDDGEVVKYFDTIAEAQAYVDEHRFDCFSRTLIIDVVYDGPNEWGE